jgi:hypothetical protein
MKRKIPLAPGPSVGVYDEVGLPVLTLWVRSRYGDFTRVSFVVDTGADCTSMLVSIAQRDGIAFPRTAASRARVSGLVGSVERYRGGIEVRLGTELFNWAVRLPPRAASAGATHPPAGRPGPCRVFE